MYRCRRWALGGDGGGGGGRLRGTEKMRTGVVGSSRDGAAPSQVLTVLWTALERENRSRGQAMVSEHTNRQAKSRQADR